MQRPFLSEGLRRRLGIAGSAVALAVIAAFFILPALAERTTSVATVLDQVDRLNSRDGKGVVWCRLRCRVRLFGHRSPDSRSTHPLGRKSASDQHASAPRI